jgi:chromosome segregation ATPase
MPLTASAPPPLAIDRVDRSRAKKNQVRLRLSGHWVSGWNGQDGPATEALLVVQLHGRRHRFAATPEDADADAGVAFTASFTIPDWAVPEQSGQAVLWVGDEVVPVPPPGTAPRAVERTASPEDRSLEVSALDEALVGAEPESAEQPSPAGDGPAGDGGAAGRSGPLADLLFKETVTALRAELEQRTAEAARLRATLAQAHGESESRGGAASGLESTHAELREELRRLIEAVSEQRSEFDAALAAAHTERDRAREELGPTRRELDAARAELADVRAELEGARTELQQARRDRDTAHDEIDGRLATARAEFDQELAAARAEGEAALAAARREAEAENDATRQETETMLAAARGDSDTRAQAAEAEARELATRLREHAAGERRRTEEAAILREQLAAAHVAREAALGEVGGLRAELERLGGELAVLREQGGDAGDELTEAQALLADARALTERLRGESSS